MQLKVMSEELEELKQQLNKRSSVSKIVKEDQSPPRTGVTKVNDRLNITADSDKST